MEFFSSWLTCIIFVSVCIFVEAQLPAFFIFSLNDVLYGLQSLCYLMIHWVFDDFFLDSRSFPSNISFGAL